MARIPERRGKTKNRLVAMKGIRKTRRLSRDIEEATDFYEMHSAALAMKFMTALGNAVRLLKEFPSIGSLRFQQVLDVPGLRCVQTDAFPYLLFYRKQGEQVLLARLLHSSRDIANLLRPDQAGSKTVPTRQNPL